ncbi:TonB-dependent receptor plug domain-containing protein [Arenibacter algicola]|uniref:TonB-dependent receptor plug domain-containing protein n=1 Tax=Arenibacter algicola TaxID=616991 RepID=UPI001C0729F9|nr:TonB-dependent receptor plug domain-containing protein [Arenibacter algicola]MBU2906074.1 TonB-dependent receptor plug domain-containing protein [Arenibacter algicola]
MKITALILFLWIAFTDCTYSQGQDNSKYFIANDSTNYREKVFLHLDKSYYNAGEDIWFKVYLLNAASHLWDAIRNVVYVDIVGPDNKIVDFKIIRIEDGIGNGDFALPSDLYGGEYTVRAYTNYMRNFDETYFFRQQLYISPLNFITKNVGTALDGNEQVESELVLEGQMPDLQFFPEGGNLVNDYFNRVGFKILGVDGRSIDIEGVILDETGAQISEFASAHLGMGLFDIKPVEGRKYTANIVHNGKKYSYNLPQGVKDGIVMRVQELKDYYQINIQTSSDKGLNGFNLFGSQRIGTIYNAKIDQDKSLAVFKVDKELLVTGIAQFTLVDEKSTAICERLVFYDDGSSSPEIKIIPLSQTNTKNGTVQLSIELDSKGQDISNFGANMSISVTDLAASSPREHQADIRTYLLLNSEVKGKIENPGYYFYSEDPKRRQFLDLLMMTQGWRQFIVNDLPNTRGDSFAFVKEMGISVEGEVRKFHNPDKPDVATVKLTFQDSNLMGRLSVKSNEDGRFKFLGLDIMEDNKLAFEMVDYDRPMKEFAIQLDSIRPAPISSLKKEHRLGETASFEQFLENPVARKGFDTNFENEMMKLIQLDEVLIITEGRSKKKEMDTKRSTSSIYSSVSNTVDFSEIRNQPYPNILAALRARVPGVDVYGGFVAIRGVNSMSSERGTTPLFLLNGVPVNQEAIENVPVWEVDFIDVLKGARASIFGSEGGNGVIAVYTLTGKELKDQKNKVAGNVFNYQGFYKPRKFYEPAYGNDDLGANRKKFSSTLHWEPTVKMDNNGKSKVIFPAGTKSSIYRVVLQGITNDGLPLASEAVFEVD